MTSHDLIFVIFFVELQFSLTNGKWQQTRFNIPTLFIWRLEIYAEYKSRENSLLANLSTLAQTVYKIFLKIKEAVTMATVVKVTYMLT